MTTHFGKNLTSEMTSPDSRLFTKVHEFERSLYRNCNAKSRFAISRKAHLFVLCDYVLGEEKMTEALLTLNSY